ncbi:MAG: trypsin-like serine protease [Myxococcales bacterium]|nr:MAG: trypsin-like serine protease [Myxococcales bacterium]
MDQVLARASQVVLIEDEQGLGAGFFVGSDGLVLTNRHVAPAAGPYRVVLSSGQNLRGLGLHQSPHFDLAVVRVATRVDEPFDLERDATDDYAVGTEVWALGHPRGCRNSVSRGIVSNPHRATDRDVFVQTDAGINPGNSGGPLLDSAGRLVGVVSAMLSNSQGIGFAVPSYLAADYVRTVRRLLRRGVISPGDDLLGPGAGDSLDDVIHAGIDTFVVRGLGRVREDASRRADVALQTDAGTVRVEWIDAALLISCALGGVGPAEASSAPLLRRLLDANGSGELRGTTLGIRGDQLQVLWRRSAEGLDRAQVFYALDQVRATALAWGPRWASLAYEGHAPAAPPAAADLPAAASDWGPPLQLPGPLPGAR